MKKIPTPHPLTETKAWRARQAIGTILSHVAEDGAAAEQEMEKAIAYRDDSRKFIRSVKGCLRDCRDNCNKALIDILFFERQQQTKSKP